MLNIHIHERYAAWGGNCTGLGWARINFLHGSSYPAMFWLCDQPSLGNSGMLQLLRAVLTPCQGLLRLSGCPASEEAGLGGGRPRAANPSGQRDVPCCEASRSAVKARGKRGDGDDTQTLGVRASALSRTRYPRGRPAFLAMAKHLPSGEAASSFFLLLYPLNCLISAHKFSPFYPSDPLPHPAGGK